MERKHKMENTASETQLASSPSTAPATKSTTPSTETKRLRFTCEGYTQKHSNVFTLCRISKFVTLIDDKTIEYPFEWIVDDDKFHDARGEKMMEWNKEEKQFYVYAAALVHHARLVHQSDADAAKQVYMRIYSHVGDIQHMPCVAIIDDYTLRVPNDFVVNVVLGDSTVVRNAKNEFMFRYDIDKDNLIVDDKAKKYVCKDMSVFK